MFRYETRIFLSIICGQLHVESKTVNIIDIQVCIVCRYLNINLTNLGNVRVKHKINAKWPEWSMFSTGYNILNILCNKTQFKKFKYVL